MFGSIGGPELLLIFVVALLIFGPRKLPELGKTLGRGLAEFRRAANDLRDSLETEVARDAGPKPAAGTSLPAGGAPPPGTLEASPGGTHDAGDTAIAAPPTDDAAESRDEPTPR
jgi:sec-independent protein translocase protein TatA